MDGTKREIRQEMRRRRRALSAAQRSAMGRAVARHVVGLRGFRDAGRVIGYVATDNEVPTEPILAAAHRAGKKVYLPRVSEGTMYFAEYERGAGLRSGALGIPEPLGAQLEERDVADAFVVVPLLAWDSSGSRVGRGGGHYDRAFGGLTRPACLVGLGYTFQQRAALPRDAWDLQLDWVVTERGALRCWCGGESPPSGKEGAQANVVSSNLADRHRARRRAGLGGGHTPAPAGRRTGSRNPRDRRSGSC
jgi:5-formyltetrahydrofolate cyclo-ligase